jgi:hypothetical protein
MAPECSVEYDAIPASSPNAASQGYPSAAPDGPEHLVVQKFNVPEDIEVVWALAHYHTGAINQSLVVDDKVVCTSMPVYGTELNVAGNEKGYLVKITNCIGPDADSKVGRKLPLLVKKGAKVEIHGWCVAFPISSFPSRSLLLSPMSPPASPAQFTPLSRLRCARVSACE